MHFVYIVAMKDQYFNDWLVMYIEKDVVDRIDNKPIIKWFQNMKTCKTKFKTLYIFERVFLWYQYI